MNELTIRFNDFPNSERTIKASLSRAKGRNVQVSVDGAAMRSARNGRTVGFIHSYALKQGLVMVSFTEVSRGVYEAHYADHKTAYLLHLEAEREEQYAANPRMAARQSVGNALIAEAYAQWVDDRERLGRRYPGEDGYDAEIDAPMPWEEGYEVVRPNIYGGGSFAQLAAFNRAVLSGKVVR